MCPSFKITGDRRHSPEGSEGMVREWLRLLSNQNIDVNALEHNEDSPSWFERFRNSTDKRVKNDYSYELLEVMEGCLACKACSNQCPVSIDAPGFRSRFLSLYYQRYMRPAKDHLVGNIKKMAPLMAKAPGFVNFFLRQGWVNQSIRKSIGYIDTPILSQPTLNQRLDKNVASQYYLAVLQTLSPAQLAKKVCVVQDLFTSFYDAEVVESLVTLINKLGYESVLFPFMPNDKPQHVKVFLKEFAKTAKNVADFLNQLDALDLQMVGVDPSMVLCYRDEYEKVLGETRGEFKVHLVHEWLLKLDLPKVTQSKTQDNALFGHCSEKIALPVSEKQWQQIFQKAGLDLSAVLVGCRGMAGTFGHEASHIQESTDIYRLSWQQAVSRYQPEQIVATGYSYRSQVARFENFKPKHPLQILAMNLE